MSLGMGIWLSLPSPAPDDSSLQGTSNSLTSQQVCWTTLTQIIEDEVLCALSYTLPSVPLSEIYSNVWVIRLQ